MSASLHRLRQPRHGLTLTELLVTMMVISILASAILFAMARAKETARVAKTKAMIAALNGVIMARVESYLTRRMPIDLSGYAPKGAAARQLKAVRELMQAELPDRWDEIKTDPEKHYQTAYHERLSRLYRTATNNSATDDYQGAECLYAIVTGVHVNRGLVVDASARVLLSNENVGDVDGDGAPEFLDGWGNPIEFIRWPAGFPSERLARDATKDHDPFDPMGLDTNAYRLVPLIVSAGPDGKMGIRFARAARYSTGSIISGVTGPNPYAQDMGEPLNDFHEDNLHNHMIGIR